MLLQMLIVGFIGLFVGGIINVLADDLPDRRKIRIPHYGDNTPRPLKAWLGITAYLTKTHISPSGSKLRWRYPATEIATALSFIMTIYAVSDDPSMTPLQLTFWLIYMAIFMLIVVIDLEHKLILFVVIIPAAGVAILDAALTPITQYAPDLQASLIGGAIGFGVSFLLYLGGFLFIYVSGKLRGHSINEVAFGYGDVMLFTLSGLILGPEALLFAIYITVILGALGAILWIAARNLSRRSYQMFTALPYGPYIVAGTVLMLLFSNDIMKLAGF